MVIIWARETSKGTSERMSVSMNYNHVAQKGRCVQRNGHNPDAASRQDTRLLRGACDHMIIF